MNDEWFNELVESVKQGGAILRGEVRPSRAFEVERDGEENFMVNSTLVDDTVIPARF